MAMVRFYFFWLSNQYDAGFGYQVRHAIRMFFFIAFPLFILTAFIETVLISSLL